MKNKKNTVHVCDACAQENGIVETPVLQPKPQKKKHSKANIENSIISAITDILALEKATQCKSCGWTYKKFKKRQRLGCPACYQALRTYLEPVYNDLQEGTEHTGKRPMRIIQTGLNQSVLRQKEIESLNKQLEMAVRTESFEQAAELRDRIKELRDEFDSLRN